MIGKPVSAAFTPYPATVVLATGAALGSTIIWGISTPVAKVALVDWPPLFQAWVRFAIALAILVPWLAMKRQRVALGRGPAILGLLGVGLFYALHNIGLQHTGAINSSLILDGGTPILTVLLAAFMLGERPHRSSVIGLIASCAGVATIIVGTNRTVTAAGYDVMQSGVPALSTGGIVLLLFLGIGCSALAYILVGYALTHLPAWQVAALSTSMPLVSLFAAVIIWREPVDPSQIVGGALILGGLVLCTPRLNEGGGGGKGGVASLRG